MERLNLYITDSQARQLKELSKITGIKAAEYIRRALDQFLRQEYREIEALLECQKKVKEWAGVDLEDQGGERLLE